MLLAAAMDKRKVRIREALIQIFTEKLEIPLDYESFSKSYLEIGINSILFIKLLVNIEIALDIEFEEEIINIGQGYVIEDLVSYIDERLVEDI